MTCLKGKGIVLGGSSRTGKGRNKYGGPRMTKFVCVAENLEAIKWSEGGTGGCDEKNEWKCQTNSRRNTEGLCALVWRG